MANSKRLIPAIIACLLALTLALVFSTGPALADGDPASDVLATGPLFLPQDAGVPVAQLRQLEELLQAADRSGYPLRVALISSAADLGSITELFHQPADYAKFLGQELSLTYRGVLLVVMPNGFGLYHQGRSVAGELAAVKGIAIHPSGAALAATVLAAVQRLAGAAGHPLAVPRAQEGGSGAQDDVVPWIVFAAGILLIALAWSASLRARPLGHPRSA